MPAVPPKEFDDLTDEEKQELYREWLKNNSLRIVEHIPDTGKLPDGLIEIPPEKIPVRGGDTRWNIH